MSITKPQILYLFIAALMVLAGGCAPSSEPIIPVDIEGTWTGSYTWNCGDVDLRGRSDLSVELRKVRNGSATNIVGTVSYLGGQATITYSNRCNEIQSHIDEYGSLQCTKTDPSGRYLILVHDGSEQFVNNEFTGKMNGDTISGTTVNGDSPIPFLEGQGCSHPDKRSGTFTLKKLD